MKQFKVIIEKNGKMTTKIFEANSMEEVKRFARSHGRVISIKKGPSGKFEFPMEMADRQVLLHRMSAMLASKVGTGTALSLMEEHFSGTIGKVSGRLLKQVENGADLGQAMETIGDKHFPPNVVALVQAGFRGGDSANALKNAAEFEAEMDSIKRGSMGEIWGGVMGFLAAAGMTFGTTRYMAPLMNESDLMKTAAENKNPVFDILAVISEISMGLITILFLALFLLATLGRGISASKADKIIAKIPFYKDLVLARNNYTTLYSLSLLFKSGVEMQVALRLSGEGAPKGAMKDDLLAAADAVKKGNPWAKEMSSLHPTDRAALSQAMDKEGILASLEAFSLQYRQLYASRISTLAPMIKGIAALFLIMSGALLFGLTIMPILQLAANGFG